MNLSPSVSVVIVSQHRPEYLENCLQALRNQTYSNFEIIVVADQLPAAFDGLVKFHQLTAKNISHARNIGLSLAAGDILAFCDDDAIADQTWLERLTQPFDDATVGSTTGFTRGRNGISLQWGASRFDRLGNDVPFDTPLNGPVSVFEPDTDCPVKLLGTNMAIRRSALAEIGGFDEAFSYYLDETDVKIRLDETGWKCAVVANAQVQHLSAASRHRAKNRVVIDPTEIASSKAYFCKKYFDGDPTDALAKFANDANTPAMQQGFDTGLALNTQYWGGELTSGMLLPFPTHIGPHVVVFCGLFGRSSAMKLAGELVNSSAKVTVLQLLPSLRYFQVKFQTGFWDVRGGTYGKSLRTQPMFQFARRKHRFSQEIERIHAQNPVEYIAFNMIGSFDHENPCLLPLKNHKVLEYQDRC